VALHFAAKTAHSFSPPRGLHRHTHTTGALRCAPTPSCWASPPQWVFPRLHGRRTWRACLQAARWNTTPCHAPPLRHRTAPATLPTTHLPASPYHPAPYLRITACCLVYLDAAFFWCPPLPTPLIPIQWMGICMAHTPTTAHIHASRRTTIPRCLPPPPHHSIATSPSPPSDALPFLPAFGTCAGGTNWTAGAGRGRGT